jgi:hypothetical protein
MVAKMSPGQFPLDKILRVMRPDGAHPRVGPTARELGVRVPQDVELDHRGQAIPGKGMSVAPTLCELPIHRIPRRLAMRQPGAAGNNEDHCFRLGKLPYLPGPVNEVLALRPDKLPRPDGRRHGQIEPAAPMQVEALQQALAETQASWVIDETEP